MEQSVNSRLAYFILDNENRLLSIIHYLQILIQ